MLPHLAVVRKKLQLPWKTKEIPMVLLDPSRRFEPPPSSPLILSGSCRGAPSLVQMCPSNMAAACHGHRNGPLCSWDSWSHLISEKRLIARNELQTVCGLIPIIDFKSSYPPVTSNKKHTKHTNYPPVMDARISSRGRAIAFF